MTCCKTQKEREDIPTLVLNYSDRSAEFSVSFDPKEDIRTLIIKVNEYLNLAARLSKNDAETNKMRETEIEYNGKKYTYTTFPEGEY